MNKFIKNIFSIILSAFVCVIIMVFLFPENALSEKKLIKSTDSPINSADMCRAKGGTFEEGVNSSVSMPNCKQEDGIWPCRNSNNINKCCNHYCTINTEQTQTTEIICGKKGTDPTPQNPNITLVDYKTWCESTYSDTDRYGASPWDDKRCLCIPQPKIYLNTPIYGATQTDTKGKSYIQGGLSSYIAGLYKFFISASIIISLCVIIISGFRWIVSGGNTTIIGKSRERIKGAVIGVLIALFSYSLLFFISPGLVRLDVFDIIALPSKKVSRKAFPVLELKGEKPYITQFFGIPFCSVAKNYSSGMHSGIDIGIGKDNTKGQGTIVAIDDGVIHKVVNTPPDPYNKDYGGGYGCHVIIKHKDKDEDGNDFEYYSLYAHIRHGAMNSNIKEKSTINKGDPIGVMGGFLNDLCAGTSTGPHLHFEIRDKDDKKIDPFEKNFLSPSDIPNCVGFAENMCKERKNIGTGVNAKTGDDPSCKT